MRLRVVLGILILFLAGNASAIFGRLPCNSALYLDSTSSYIPWSQFVAETYGSIAPGDDVLVPCGTAVEITSERIPKLGSLEINGFLRIAPSSYVTILADYILVQGRLDVGAEEGHTDGQKVSFLLTEGKPLSYTRDGQSVELGKRTFALVGGQVRMYGVHGGEACMKKTWTKIARTVPRRTNKIVVEGDVIQCWKPGMRIVISATGESEEEAEMATIVAVTCGPGCQTSEIFIDMALNYEHSGLEVQVTAKNGKAVSLAGEVGLLSRDITISSEIGESNSKDGGHMQIHETLDTQTIHGVEIVGLGIEGELGKYPMHFHLCGDQQGSSFSSNTIYNGLQRGLVIHQTDNVLAEDNVFHHIVGHGLVLEDGVEVGNIMRRNIGFRNFVQENLIVKDGRKQTDNRPSMFWLSNPNNIVEYNVCSGSDLAGIWYELETFVTGVSKERPEYEGLNPQAVELGSFVANEAHSNHGFGFQTYPDGYRPLQQAVFKDYLGWRNRIGVFMHESTNLVIENAFLVDNRDSAIFFRETSSLVFRDSVIVGKSDTWNRCPLNGAIDMQGSRKDSSTENGTQFIDLRLDKFADCSHPLVSMNTGNPRKTGFFRASTAMIGVFADDQSNVFNFDSAVTANDRRFDFYAIRIEGGNLFGGRSGYVTPTELVQQSRNTNSCVMVGSYSNFCPNTCQRSISIAIPTNIGSTYSMKLTRLSDGGESTSEKLKAVRKQEVFHFNVLGGRAYIVSLASSQGYPKEFVIDYEDGEGACSGTVDLLFEQNHRNYKGEEDNPNFFLAPCRGGEVSYPAGTPFFYDYCEGDDFYRRVRLPAGPMTNRPSALRIRRDYTIPKAVSPCSQSHYGHCKLVSGEEEWKYTDETFTGVQATTISQSFRGDDFDDSTWKTARAAFGYSVPKLNTIFEHRHISYYFRKTFNVSGDAIQCLEGPNASLKLRYGDGFIAYINGVRVLSKNLLSTTPIAESLATAKGEQNKFEEFRMTIYNGLLREGSNLIAVEVHRYEKERALFKSVAFDLKLEPTIKKVCPKYINY
ncbi:hypothetical protein NDN08_004053 [Rhodosorus marinus]|uniref:G8 domain-containing protein n=1 Tax=Rhodosorus marinus TaxID=101924 RepID=A0AAV8UH68_9RHOD|nr:hypothetical protein NDN08_004053 [Rhodosorus marinus]